MYPKTIHNAHLVEFQIVGKSVGTLCEINPKQWKWKQVNLKNVNIYPKGLALC